MPDPIILALVTVSAEHSQMRTDCSCRLSPFRRLRNARMLRTREVTTKIRPMLNFSRFSMNLSTFCVTLVGKMTSCLPQSSGDQISVTESTKVRVVLKTQVSCSEYGHSRHCQWNLFIAELWMCFIGSTTGCTITEKAPTRAFS